MPELQNIRTKNWTLSIKGPGLIVEDDEAVEQGILILANTQRGSDPVDIEMGVDQLGLLDKPINQVIPTLIKDYTNQIARYEKRAIIISITGEFTQANGNSQVIITITRQTINGPAQTIVHFNL